MAAKRLMEYGLLVAAGLFGLSSVASAQELREGAVFPDFSEKDMNTGKTIKLEDFRGKVVLVDFWATWCGPCKAELPNVKKAYEKYHSKGFDIISISLDQKIETCKDFVKENEMPWNHICDGAYWNAKLAKKHKVNAIPRAVLIGKDGKILSAEARGGELTKAIEQGLAAKGPEPAADDEIDKAAKVELAKADKLRKDGKYADALAIYDELGKKYPARDAGKAANQKARELREDPDVMKKIESQKSSAADEEAAKGSATWFKTARTMAEQKKYELARNYYKKIIDKYPKTKAAKTAEEEMKKLPEK